MSRPDKLLKQKISVNIIRWRRLLTPLEQHRRKTNFWIKYNESLIAIKRDSNEYRSPHPSLCESKGAWTMSKALHHKSTAAGINIEYDSPGEKNTTLNRSSVMFLMLSTEPIKWRRRRSLWWWGESNKQSLSALGRLTALDYATGRLEWLCSLALNRRLTQSFNLSPCRHHLPTHSTTTIIRHCCQ